MKSLHTSSQNSGLNVLVTTSSFPISPIETSGSFIYDYVNHLQQMFKYNVFVLAPHKLGLPIFSDYLGICLWRFRYLFPASLEKVAYFGGIPYNIKHDWVARVGLPFFILSEYLHISYLVRKWDIQILHSQWLLPQGFVGAFYKHLHPNTSHIVTIHSSEVTFLKKSVPGSRIILQYILKHSDSIVSVSEHRKKELLGILSTNSREQYVKKIQVIPMGVSSKLPQNNGEDFDKEREKKQIGIRTKWVLLCVGRFVEVKGFDYALKAFNMVCNQRRDVTLIIVGNGPLEQQFHQYVSDHHLWEYVLFPGFIPHDNVDTYYKIADILVFSSIIDSDGYQEGLPVVLLEGLGYGLPIIGTRTNGVLEIIQDGQNGVLVSEKDPEEMASKILSLLSSPDQIIHLRENALISSKEYAWERVVSRNEEIYRNLGKET